MIRLLGAMVGASGKADRLIAELRAGVEAVAESAALLPRRPRIYFEEWDAPLITGIGWVSELIRLAGGEDCFPELAGRRLAKERILADPAEVVRRAPDIIVGSWCGKKFRPEQVAARPGWAAIPAVRDGALYEIKSSEILSPGPAALTDGLCRLHEIVRSWCDRENTRAAQQAVRP
jgi:iron complex transport system substrate-binding protein